MNKAHIFLCSLALIFSNGCSVFYVMKQGVYQFSMLSGAEPIEEALRKPDLDLKKRKKLELILSVRSFAKHQLKLDVHKNYKDINLNWDKRINIVSASAALQFKPYLWWFPVIGYVPYKGFFNEADADKEQKSLAEQGYETQKREISGYSTLGFFADPVWPSMLNMSDHALAELIIHELAHATVYIPNQTPFNETFANFVGQQGAHAYAAYRFGKDSEVAKAWVKNDQNAERYQQFFHELYEELDRLYASELSDQEKQEKKKAIFAKADARYEILVKENLVPGIDFSKINNAYLLSFKSYNEDFSVFDKLLSLVGGDFGEFISEVNYYARTSTPFLSLRDRVQQLEAKK